MHKLRLENKRKVAFLILVLFCLLLFFILIPIWFANYLSLSGVAHFFSKNVIYSLISALILLYFIIVGVFYYNIKIDSYVIQINAYRVLFDFFKEKDSIDISHTMLVDYTFFNRRFSLNKTLMLRIETNSKRKIVKRYNMTLISKKEIRKLRRVLDSIILKRK